MSLTHTRARQLLEGAEALDANLVSTLSLSGGVAAFAYVRGASPENLARRPEKASTLEPLTTLEPLSVGGAYVRGARQEEARAVEGGRGAAAKNGSSQGNLKNGSSHGSLQKGSSQARGGYGASVNGVSGSPDGGKMGRGRDLLRTVQVPPILRSCEGAFLSDEMYLLIIFRMSTPPHNR